MVRRPMPGFTAVLLAASAASAFKAASSSSVLRCASWAASYSETVEEFVVPVDGTYRITACGAKAADGSDHTVSSQAI